MFLHEVLLHLEIHGIYERVNTKGIALSLFTIVIGDNIVPIIMKHLYLVTQPLAIVPSKQTTIKPQNLYKSGLSINLCHFIYVF